MLAAAHWGSLGVATGLAAAVAGPMLLGAQPMMVRSGSMEPLIHTGDLVVVRAIAPDSIEIGDVVTFADPKGSGRLITHRVRDLEIEGDRVTVATKGDAVTSSETWTVPRAGTIGKVEYRIWKAGYVVAWFKSPAALLAVGVAAALALTRWVLLGIWRPEAS
jgi:signal peptidase